MICNNCRYQSPDGLNFCPNCGIQFNPNAFRAQQVPQSVSNFNIPATETPDAAQKSIFTLGLIAFGVNMIWILIGLFNDLMGYEFYMRFSIVFKIISLVTTVASLFFSFLFVKKQSYKTTLLILFIVLVLIEIIRIFLRQFFGSMF